MRLLCALDVILQLAEAVPVGFAYAGFERNVRWLGRGGAGK